MMTAPDPADIERARAFVARRLGLRVENGRLASLSEVLLRRMEATGVDSAAAYLDAAQSPARAREELRALAEHLTVTETYFFRDPNHFRALAEVVVPDRARGGARRLRLLSAGCASGEEAYSLAIALRERLPDLAAWQLSIRGIDVNAAMIEKARRARYTAWALRETPDAVRGRFFRAEGREFALDPDVRAMASFEERNLLDEDPDLWRPDAFDAIFCRNVTMYFPIETARAVIARLAGALAPGGYLFLGHAETLRGISNAFHLRHTHGAFYYQRRHALEPAREPIGPLPPAAEAAPPASPSVPALDPSTSWFDAIRTASERIARLAVRARPADGADAAPPAAPAVGVAATSSRDLGPALELMRQERFAAALDILGRLAPGTPADPDAQLLRAVLLTNTGERAEAERVCRALLEADDLHAGAHYLMALCREHAGDPRGALEHDQAALYLDAEFAMPRFHLGLLARRAVDLATARRELSRALELFAREDASRILLFGGGFNREALIRLCRSELHACGGAP